jgi:Cu+-exporting ATPase
VDKTGTLTEGKPRLTQIIPVDGVTEDDLLVAAASVEQNSEHPLAAAIVHGAKERKVKLQPVTDFNSITGGGVVGKIGGREITVGKLKFLQERGVAGLENIESKATALQAEGQTAMFVAINGKAAGILTVSDPIKASTPEAIAQLHKLGLKIIMLTGDNERTANAVAKKLGLDQVSGCCTAGQTRAHPATAQARSNRGDGWRRHQRRARTSRRQRRHRHGNRHRRGDGKRGHHARQRRPAGIAKAITLSRSMMRNIRQNLFFAFAYNAVGIPIAAGLLYPFSVCS